jgi:hypothetical protein
METVRLKILFPKKQQNRARCTAGVSTSCMYLSAIAFVLRALISLNRAIEDFEAVNLFGFEGDEGSFHEDSLGV